MLDGLFEEGSFERIWIPIVILAFLFLHGYFMMIFWQKHFWWILLMFAYLVYFIHNDQILKYKEYKEKLEVKETKERRIDFW